MKLIFLYRPKSEHYGQVMDFVRDYKQLHPQVKLEMISLDTVEGAELAKLYDIYAYPAILAISQDGELQQAWQATPLPLMKELDAYALS